MNSSEPSKSRPLTASARSRALAEKLLQPVATGHKRSNFHRLRLLTLGVETLAEVIEWLTVENATYATARARLQERGTQVSETSLWKLFHACLKPLLSKAPTVCGDSITVEIPAGTAARITIRGTNLSDVVTDEPGRPLKTSA